MAKAKDQFDAWNPGLNSEIPATLMPRVTLYDPRNSDVGYRDAKEAAAFCGLKPHEMVAFKASRLVVHEVLIRVTADLHVPDGPNYEDLGLSLRGMAARILNAHVQPRMAEIESAFAKLRTDVEQRLDELMEWDIYERGTPAPTDRPGLLARLLRKTESAPVEPGPPELRAISAWQDAVAKPGTPIEQACLSGLLAIVAGIVGQRGRLMADKALVIRLAANRICNTYGSRIIGDMTGPIIREAAKAEHYRYLPFQKAPVVLNVKGASAAGKSTIRPLQRKLAERLGVPWEDFALVSPDYWRKFLLDYKSLGDNFKYAAMLTGQELEIIDKKLDDYMEAKAMRSEMPHLLIDRFRFDSFASPTAPESDGRLLSRFGDTVFMFFVITPPPETVERAWKRGIETGRFKAVDDLLYHNIEAYTGMPQLFFNWVKKERQKVHFEFLDNSVPLGDQPKTAAFGWNDKITILDMDCMRRLSRYQRVNVDARRPEEVLLEQDATERDILLDCIERIADVTFVNPETLEIVGHTKDGRCDYERDGFFAKSSLEKACGTRPSGADKPVLDAGHERKFTVGAW
ncbi:MAG: hypothetical protein R3E44_01975 [Paracoccaceae bacterium]